MESKGEEAVVLRQDSFKISGNGVTVSLTNQGIEWSGEGKSRNGSLEWADVLNVTPIPASCRKPKGPGATLHYISKPNKVWRQATVTFTASEEQGATSWVERVNGLLMEKVPQRPRRLLVLVNPKSGASKGVKIYESKAAPIFKLAGISTDVTVTERAHHAVEMITNTDLSRYDGVVAVGGDGTLTECLAGLALKARREAGIDPDDPDSNLPFLDMRVGLIPAGTGQGMVEAATGSKGVENAVLHIIYGEVWDMDLFTTHSGRHLLYTSCLLGGYGFFGEAIRISESNRHLGRMRYPYAMTKAAVNIRRFKVNVDILVQGADGKPPEWISRHGQEYVNVFHFMMNPHNTRIHNGFLHVYLEKQGPGLKPAIFFAKLVIPGHVEIPPFIEYMEALSYKITPCTTEDGGSPGGAAAGPAGNMPFETLNIDGEMFKLQAPEIRFKVHPKSVKMFGAYFNHFLAEQARKEAASGQASGSSG